jgi:hypothetical protein
MPNPKKHKNKKKQKKTKKGMKIIPMPAAGTASEEEENEDESGMYLDKESIQIIYNALHEYKPTKSEEHLHSLLLEEFEEILVVDYNEL